MGPFFSHHSTWWRPFLKWCSAKVLKKDIVIANPKKLHSRETPDLEKFLQNQLWRWFLSHLGAIQWTIEHMGKLWFSPNRCRWLHLHPVLKWNIHLSRWKLDHLQNFFPAKKKLGPPKPHWKGAQNPHPQREQQDICSTQQVLRGWTTSSTVSSKKNRVI